MRGLSLPDTYSGEASDDVPRRGRLQGSHTHEVKRAAKQTPMEGDHNSLPDTFPSEDKRVRIPPGRPQGSHPLIHILSRPYYDSELLAEPTRSHSKGRGGRERMRGPLWLPWEGVGPRRDGLSPSLPRAMR